MIVVVSVNALVSCVLPVPTGQGNTMYTYLQLLAWISHLGRLLKGSRYAQQGNLRRSNKLRCERRIRVHGTMTKSRAVAGEMSTARW